jgi:hypothetical protein
LTPLRLSAEVLPVFRERLHEQFRNLGLRDAHDTNAKPPRAHQRELFG